MLSFPDPWHALLATQSEVGAIHSHYQKINAKLGEAIFNHLSDLIARVDEVRPPATFLMLASLIWVTALADGSSSTVDSAAGKTVYTQTCIACHGANGKGAIPGVQDLTVTDGPLSKSDEELLASIAEGFQSSGSPMAMPPKGGNPTLTLDDIRAVISYLRTEFVD